MLSDKIIKKEDVPSKLIKLELVNYLIADKQAIVESAFYYMLKKYREKKIYRANGDPAELHPLQVAKVLDFDSKLMVIALLHDIVEDIPENEEERKKIFEEIEELFGKEIKSSVYELTKNSDDTKNYLRNIKRTDSILVKQADTLTNIRSAPSKKLYYLKKGLPEKVSTLLEFTTQKKINKNSIEYLALKKYNAKLIEETHRLYETQIRHLRELYKDYLREITILEKVITNFMKKYDGVRKKNYEEFLKYLSKKEYENHLLIEIKKRTKEALIASMPLNANLISIEQNKRLVKISKKKYPELTQKLENAINQQIKFAQLEISRLKEYYLLIQENRKLLSKEDLEQIIVPEKRIEELEKISKKVT